MHKIQPPSPPVRLRVRDTPFRRIHWNRNLSSVPDSALLRDFDSGISSREEPCSEESRR